MKIFRLKILLTCMQYFILPLLLFITECSHFIRHRPPKTLEGGQGQQNWNLIVILFASHMCKSMTYFVKWFLKNCQLLKTPRNTVYVVRCPLLIVLKVKKLPSSNLYENYSYNLLYTEMYRNILTSLIY